MGLQGRCVAVAALYQRGTLSVYLSAVLTCLSLSACCPSHASVILRSNIAKRLLPLRVVMHACMHAHMCMYI